METGTPKPFPTETCWARLADASFSLRPLTRSAAHSTCRRHSQPTPQLPPALDAVAAPRLAGLQPAPSPPPTPRGAWPHCASWLTGTADGVVRDL